MMPVMPLFTHSDNSPPIIQSMITNMGPGVTVRIRYNGSEDQPITCEQIIIPPPGISSDVIFGWASVIVIGTLLWAYVVTHKKELKVTR